MGKRIVMKTTIAILAGVIAATSAHAQLFTPSTVGGAALGAVAGGVIGNNTGSGNGTHGAVIGAVAGGLLGSAYAQSKRETSPYGAYSSSAYPAYHYAHGPAYAPPIYRTTPSYARPSRTATTTLLGGVAGAIIGHNNGRRGWEGAAIGAGAGYVFGRLTEPTRVVRYSHVGTYAPYAYYSAPVVRTQPAAPQPPQRITIINNYYGTAATPMSTANAMFGR